METAHESQVKYYLFKLKQHGIEGVTGMLDYATLRHTPQITRTDDDILSREKWEVDIIEITSRKEMPVVIDKPVCKRVAIMIFVIPKSNQHYGGYT